MSDTENNDEADSEEPVLTFDEWMDQWEAVALSGIGCCGKAEAEKRYWEMIRKTK